MLDTRQTAPAGTVSTRISREASDSTSVLAVGDHCHHLQLSSTPARCTSVTHLPHSDSRNCAYTVSTHASARNHLPYRTVVMATLLGKPEFCVTRFLLPRSTIHTRYPLLHILRIDKLCTPSGEQKYNTNEIRLCEIRLANRCYSSVSV